MSCKDVWRPTQKQRVALTQPQRHSKVAGTPGRLMFNILLRSGGAMDFEGKVDRRKLCWDAEVCFKMP